MTQFSVPWQSRPAATYGIFARAIIAVARLVSAVALPLLNRFPGLTLLGAVVAACLLVWAHALVFAYVDQHILEPAIASAAGVRPESSLLSPGTWGLAPSAMRELIVGAGGWPAALAGVLQYALWPVQFGIVRDLIGLTAIFVLFNVVPVYAIWWERKVAGRIQSRLGPMRVGRWHGWAQSFADGIKLVLKEDLVPKDADKVLFRVAPYLAIIPTMLAFVALPFAATYMFRQLDVALVFILSMLGIEVVSVIVAGWASNNKWSVYGGMREACQMVAYEIPMGMSLLVPIACVGSLSLVTVGEAQSGGWFTWLAFSNPFAFVAFVSYFIASLASCKRAPFDLPEAESELVAGFLTEYSGFRWALFFFAEYVSMFVVAALASILFLGGWHSPLPSSWGAVFDAWAGSGGLLGLCGAGLKGLLFAGPIWLLLKCVFFIYVQLWVRWTLPRIRLDQVLYACVQVLLPLTMLVLVGTAVWVWVSTWGSDGWATFEMVVRWILGVIGLVFALGFPAIAAYGFYHRRRLVGYLVVDPLRGS